MSKLDGVNLRVVLYEGPGAATLDGDARFEIMSSLLNAGHELTFTTSRDRIDSHGSDFLLVLGRFDERPPDDVSAGNGVVDVLFREVGGLDAEHVLALVNQVTTDSAVRQRGQWKPWFPVIDFDRCTNCMQCLSFCLFDVYSVDADQKITVQKQDNCKTDCPACSRVCPEAAILFPKYRKGPINGDVVREEDLKREAMKVDVSALLGGDIYAALRTRQRDARERFSTERDESRALLERKRCLKKLQDNLDIPDEVLMSLPSAGDIQERAARAKAKNEKRMQRSQTVKDQRPAPSVDDWGI